MHAPRRGALLKRRRSPEHIPRLAPHLANRAGAALAARQRPHSPVSRRAGTPTPTQSGAQGKILRAPHASAVSHDTARTCPERHTARPHRHPRTSSVFLRATARRAGVRHPTRPRAGGRRDRGRGRPWTIVWRRGSLQAARRAAVWASRHAEMRHVASAASRQAPMLGRAFRVSTCF